MAKAKRTKALAKRSPAKTRAVVRKPAKPRTPPASQVIVRLGGKLLDVTAWPEAIVEEIKRVYLLPPAVDRLFLARVTLTGTCPARHSTQHSVGFMADSAEMVKQLADAIPRARATTNCPECGKRATVTGKHVYWAGPMGDWDGAL